MPPWSIIYHCHELCMALQYLISLGVGEFSLHYQVGPNSYCFILYLWQIIITSYFICGTWCNLAVNILWWSLQDIHRPSSVFWLSFPISLLGTSSFPFNFTLNLREVITSFPSLFPSAEEANPFFVWPIAIKVWFKTLGHNSKNYQPGEIKVYIATGTNPMFIPKPIYMVPFIALNMILYLY